jgi:Amidase
VKSPDFERSSIHSPVGAIEDWTIAAVRRAIVRGEVSAEQLTRHHLDRIANLNGTLNAMVTLDDGALLAARRLDDEFSSRRTLVGPLHGIPVVVKDNFETAGVATSFGSAAFSSYAPAQRRGCGDWQGNDAGLRGVVARPFLAIGHHPQPPRSAA